jgi:hypothetical protein
VVAGTPAATPAAAAAIVEGTRGGIVLDVSPSTDSPAAVAETVVELGELLGYVRVPAHELGAATAPGLLATLPPQVPVVIGEPPTAASTAPAHPAGPGGPAISTASGGPGRPGPPSALGDPTGPDDSTAAAEQAEAEILARLTAWRTAVDELLRHPAASDR